MDSKGLQLKVGDFITVVKWLSHNDNSYRGDCLEVKLINYPYLRVELRGYPAGSLGQRKFTLNLEQVEIMPLSEEFVKDVLKGERQ